MAVPHAHGVGMVTSSAAGKSVTATSALSLSTVWSCSRLQAQTAATMPLFLYDTDGNNQRRLAVDHPLYQILHSQPHFDFTAVEFWEGVVLSLVLWGNAYALKQRIGDRLVSLEPLRCDLMRVERNANGARQYRYANPKGERVYPEDDIFHVRGFGGAGDEGLSVIGFARQSIGAALAADEFAAASFRNGAMPTGALTVDQVLSPEQRKQVQDNIVAPMIGSGNAGGIMVLEAAMKFMPLSWSNEDSQFLETRQFQVEDICRWFGVPPFMIGHTQSVTNFGTGLEQQLMGYLMFSLRPILIRIEQAIRRSLITPAERGRLVPEFAVEGLLRADSKGRAQFYATMVQNGIMSRNEVRRLENLPPQAGADALTVQSQNVPLGANPTAGTDDGE
jgi:HK97 family phage portal protein